MKGLKLKSSFTFIDVSDNEYEVRVEKRSNFLKDFNVFKNGEYEVTYNSSYRANESNAKEILIYFLRK